ncbi:hypothetical protein HAZELMIKA_55 [Klebsiella phage vB_KaeD_HazelMika]|nr:hypothetical protein HAZELMIKA_55 [Klebsiella phage vB_KaeD_HazelMika]
MKIIKRWTNRGKCKGMLRHIACMKWVYSHLYDTEALFRPGANKWARKYGEIWIKLNRYEKQLTR